MNLATTAIVQHPAEQNSHPHHGRSTGLIGKESIAKSIQGCEQPFFALSLSLLEYTLSRSVTPASADDIRYRIVPGEMFLVQSADFLLTSIPRLPNTLALAYRKCYSGRERGIVCGWRNPRIQPPSRWAARAAGNGRRSGAGRRYPPSGVPNSLGRLSWRAGRKRATRSVASEAERKVPSCCEPLQPQLLKPSPSCSALSSVGPWSPISSSTTPSISGLCSSLCCTLCRSQWRHCASTMPCCPSSSPTFGWAGPSSAGSWC